MNIPDEAIAKAARIISFVDYPDYEDDPELTRKVLEAAAPLIAAQAWTEGFMAGRLVEINGWPNNPYGDLRAGETFTHSTTPTAANKAANKHVGPMEENK